MKDYGDLNGDPLRIVEAGNGPFIVYGRIRFAMPGAWRDRPEGLSREFLTKFVENRMATCPTLRVSNVPFDADEALIQELFDKEQFPLATDGEAVLVERHPGGASKGLAYVRMRDGAVATAALALSGVSVKTGRHGEQRQIWIAKCFSKSPLAPQDSDAGSDHEAGAGRMPAKQRMQTLVFNITRLPLDPLLASQVSDLEEQAVGDRFEALGALARDPGVCKLLDTHRVSERTACKLISELGRQHDLRKAIAVYAWMRNHEEVKPNVFHLNALISACDRCGSWNTALRFLGELRALGLEPDTITFSTLISACSRGRRWDLGLQLLETMTAAKVVPNIITFNALISSCEKAGRPLEAFNCFEALNQAGLKADTVTYSALVSACEKVGDWERAWELYEDCRRSGVVPDTILYNALISACDKGGQPGEADRAFEMMTLDGVRPDLITFCSRISAHATVGDKVRAEAVFHEMQAAHIKPSIAVFHELLRSCQVSLDWTAAEGWLAELRSAGLEPTAFTFGLLTLACEQAGETERAANYDALRLGEAKLTS